MSFVRPRELVSFVRPRELVSFVRPRELVSIVRPGELVRFVHPRELVSFVRPKELVSFVRPKELVSFVRPRELVSFVRLGELVSFCIGKFQTRISLLHSCQENPERKLPRTATKTPITYHFVPRRWKPNTALGALHRAKQIASNWKAEVKTIKQSLKQDTPRN